MDMEKEKAAMGNKKLVFTILGILIMILSVRAAAYVEPMHDALANVVGYGGMTAGIVVAAVGCERSKEKFEKQCKEKKYYFNQEVIKEQAKIQAAFDAEEKAKIENEIELTKLWIEKNKITDAQEELINLKRKETNQKERELQVKEDKFLEIETELERTKAELEAIYDTEIYKLGVQAVERKKMTANLKKFILERDDYTCQVCGASLHNDFNLKLEVDHIVPISKGGKTDPSNLQTLCRKCNRSKGAKSMEVFVGAK